MNPLALFGFLAVAVFTSLPQMGTINEEEKDGGNALMRPLAVTISPADSTNAADGAAPGAVASAAETASAAASPSVVAGDTAAPDDFEDLSTTELDERLLEGHTVAQSCAFKTKAEALRQKKIEELRALTIANQKAIGTTLPRTTSGWQAHESDFLLQAIESDDVVKVREKLEAAKVELDKELDGDPAEPAAGSVLDFVLTEPSLVAAHSFHTPLMAAVARGDLAIFTSLLHRFEQRFDTTSIDKTTKTKRDKAMRVQLSTQGVLGNNLVMLAAAKGDMPILKAVMAEISHIKAWSLLQKSDFEGQTLLMHAARAGNAAVFRMIHQVMASNEAKNGEEKMDLCKQMKARSGDGKTILMHAAMSGDAMVFTEVVLAHKRTCEPSALRQILHETDVAGMSFLMHSVAVVDDEQAGGKKEDKPAKPDGTEQDLHKSVPVFNIALALVTESLWKGQLMARDFCGRNVLTHALLSRHEALFEAVLNAVRSDLLDSEVEDMLNVNEENLQNLPLRTAFLGGEKQLQNLFVKRSDQLKGDISVRAKLSTIENKIQSFVPGKLIVTFQLMLPETDRQLVLLVVLCVMAPVLSWAGALVTNGPRNTADLRSAVGRKSGISHMLAAPALFFWGVGTSTIGKELNWEDSFTAAMLAVATIVIPGIDSFFNSPKIELWYEQVTCQENRFYVKAYIDWKQKGSVPFPFGRKTDDTFVMPARQERGSLASADSPTPSPEDSSLKALFQKMVPARFWKPQQSDVNVSRTGTGGDPEPSVVNEGA